MTLTNTIAAVPLAPGQSQQESIVFPGINCDPDVYEVTATVTADSDERRGRVQRDQQLEKSDIRPRMSGGLARRRSAASALAARR